MADLRKMVIPRVAARWVILADYLRLELSRVDIIRQKHPNDPERCCREVFVCWLTSDEGISPKTWGKLINVLKEITDLTVATEQIELELKERYSSNQPVKTDRDHPSDEQFMPAAKKPSLFVPPLCSNHHFTLKEVYDGDTFFCPSSAGGDCDVSNYYSDLLPNASTVSMQAAHIEQPKPALLQHSIFSIEPSMHHLNKIVVPEVAAEWKDVAYALGYRVSAVKLIQSKCKEDPKKCCKDLFEDWLSTDNGVKPKTWQTLIDKLKEVDELHSATEEITKKIKSDDIKA